MKYCTFLFINIFLISYAWAQSFDELVKRIDEHQLLKSQLDRVNAQFEKARLSGSWGDPKLSVMAMNFPKDSLSQNESMMTGIQFGLSQKLNLSGKYGKLRESIEEGSKSSLAESKQLKREFVKMLWNFAIEKERLIKEEDILSENLSWIETNLKVSKRLYVTGKVPQQAVLDIQIRKSALVAQIDKNKFARQALQYQLATLFNSEQKIDVNLTSMPWAHLETWSTTNDKFDFKKQALQHQLKASELKLSAQNRNFMPDITLGVTYTQRNDIDGIGDFVGASISFPIPTSDVRYAAKKEAAFKRLEAERKYRYYLNTKPNFLKKLEYEIKDDSNQLSILQTQTLKFAKSSRDITAKSYARGASDYLELLRSEFQYQEQRLKEISLIAAVKNKKLNYLFLKGDHLKAEKTK